LRLLRSSLKAARAICSGVHLRSRNSNNFRSRRYISLFLRVVLSYVCNVKEHPERGLPRPTLATVFEVAIDGKVYRVAGKALWRRIIERRSSLKGPKGYLFGQRPMLE
jgi:hypothetical protein